MDIGERIRYLRKDLLNLTLDKFGDKLGLKKSTLSTIENGIGSVTNHLRLSIVREFNVNEQWLLTGEGEPFTKKSRQEELEAFFKDVEMGTNDFKTAFVSALAKMTVEDWESLEKVCTKLAAEAVAEAKKKELEESSTKELEAIYKNETLPSLSEKAHTISNTSVDEKKDA